MSELALVEVMVPQQVGAVVLVVLPQMVASAKPQVVAVASSLASVSLLALPLASALATIQVLASP